jgi:ribosomal protein S18 acetylase RimI-like enzyme
VELRQHSVRLMESNDEAQVRALLESDPDFFMSTQGAPPGPTDALGLLNEMPEGKELSDKFVYVVFNRDGVLSAVIDLLRGYPKDDIWYLGLIFVAPASRGLGLGTRAIEAICAHVRQQGGHALRLGVVREHLRARALYDRTGFHFLCERVRFPPNGFKVLIIVLERDLLPTGAP